MGPDLFLTPTGAGSAECRVAIVMCRSDSQGGSSRSVQC